MFSNRSNLNIKNKLLILGFALMLVLGLIDSSRDEIIYEDVTNEDGNIAGVNIGTIEEDFYEGPFEVLSVTDGDTFRVSYYGENTPVRLIGIDAPESGNSKEKSECFSKESTEILTDLLLGEYILLEKDPQTNDRDGYNRLLRYAIIDNKDDVGLLMIQKGAALEYEYTKYKYASEYKRAQQEAKELELGMWNISKYKLE
ncbi:thermonuclease family protein [Patescibacteria group bacterium]|nr:thermonuclease family protein [Patescibacteria group bacterium]